MDKDKVLDEIFNDDPFGLLNVKPKVSNVRTADERLIASFEEINKFVEQNGANASDEIVLKKELKFTLAVEVSVFLC